VKLSKLLALPNVKIILFILETGEARYSQLSKLVSSRGALWNAFKELNDEKLIQRRVEETTPIQSYYGLTKKGRELGLELAKIKRVLEI
jgi:DNA-binding HxlR family transcriptional regulator